MPVEPSPQFFRFVLNLIMPNAQLFRTAQLGSHFSNLWVANERLKSWTCLPDIHNLPDWVVRICRQVHQPDRLCNACIISIFDHS